MRRPTTGSTTVYPHLEKLTADDHAIIRRLAHDADDPHAFQTSLIAGRALCAIALCGRPGVPGDGALGVMIMQMAWPEGYLPDASFERAAKAIGVAEIVEGPRWEVRRFAKQQAECPNCGESAGHDVCCPRQEDLEVSDRDCIIRTMESAHEAELAALKKDADAMRFELQEAERVMQLLYDLCPSMDFGDSPSEKNYRREVLREGRDWLTRRAKAVMGEHDAEPKEPPCQK